MAFYASLDTAEDVRPTSRDMSHMIVGTQQPTPTTIQLSHGTAHVTNTFGSTNDYGDTTVPLAGAIGHRLPMDTNLLVRIPDHHGNLQRNQVALDQITEILTATPIRRRSTQTIPLQVEAPDLLLTTEPLTVTVTVGLHATDDQHDPRTHAVRITVTDENGRAVAAQQPKPTCNRTEARFAGLPPAPTRSTSPGQPPPAPSCPSPPPPSCGTQPRDEARPVGTAQGTVDTQPVGIDLAGIITVLLEAATCVTSPRLAIEEQGVAVVTVFVV